MVVDDFLLLFSPGVSTESVVLETLLSFNQLHKGSQTP